MDGLNLSKFGLQEIDGGTVFGGEMIGPLGIALIVCGVGYLAANWVVLGRTTGRGKNDQTGKPRRELLDDELWKYFIG